MRYVSLEFRWIQLAEQLEGPVSFLVASVTSAITRCIDEGFLHVLLRPCLKVLQGRQGALMETITEELPQSILVGDAPTLHALDHELCLVILRTGGLLPTVA